MYLRNLLLPAFAALALSVTAAGAANVDEARPQPTMNSLVSSDRNAAMMATSRDEGTATLRRAPDISPMVHGKDATITADPRRTGYSWWKDE